MSAVAALRAKFRFDKDSPWHFYRMVALYSLLFRLSLVVLTEAISIRRMAPQS